MLTDEDANSSEKEGGWVSRPPRYQSQVLNNFFKKNKRDRKSKHLVSES